MIADSRKWIPESVLADYHDSQTTPDKAPSDIVASEPSQGKGTEKQTGSGSCWVNADDRPVFTTKDNATFAILLREAWTSIIMGVINWRLNNVY